jgi:hypothetical protein
MHYSAARLLQVFPKYFTAHEALSFAYDDERIAERLYGGRLGNYPEGQGDGYLLSRPRPHSAHRPRQLSRLLARRERRRRRGPPGARRGSRYYAALTAAWFWQTRGCNELADRRRVRRHHARHQWWLERPGRSRVMARPGATRHRYWLNPFFERGTTVGPLHVIAVISNPLRFNSRYALYRDFARHVRQSGAVLHTVELAYGKRPLELTEDHGADHYYPYRTHEELWHKENLIQLGIARLGLHFPDWEYVAWVDADVQFTRPDWADETVHQLQHYKIVQMWTEALDLGPQHQILEHHTGYVYAWHQKGELAKPAYGGGGLVFHPGYAWAARRDALEAIGGLIDYAIMGSGDTHMAGAFTGCVERTFHKGMSADYKHALKHYQRLCEKHLRRKVGYVETALTHRWHGKKKHRGYSDRWKVLSDNGYSPYTDIIRRPDGVLALTSEKRGLRDGLMRYFRSRNEDSIDV